MEQPETMNSAVGNTALNQAEAEPTPVDARVLVTLAEDQLSASVLVEPPMAGGQDVTLEKLEAALRSAGVTFGVKSAALGKLATPLYDEPVLVAEGQPALNGEDGVCTEHFSRSLEKQMSVDDTNKVNYRELGAIREVRAGTLICECTPATKGVDGTTVGGKTIKATDGKKAIVPVGEGVTTDAEGLRSQAAVTGHLTFRDGRFCVDTVYRVQDVDYNVGNITFSGDVIVNGNMLDGFEIHSGGTVTLRGQLGAVVVEGEHIVIENGVNGNGKALIDAKKTLHAGFIENCTILVGERLTASILLNCTVSCEGEIDVVQGKGIICGGKLTSFGKVRAKVVGNDSQTLTTIALGVTPKLIAERKELDEKLESVRGHIDEINKNIAYIERLVADGRPIPPERVQFLQRSKIQLPMSEKKMEQLNAQLQALEQRMQDVQDVTLTAGTIYPPTKVTIGAQKKNIIEMQTNCRVYKNSQGEISLGNA